MIIKDSNTVLLITDIIFSMVTIIANWKCNCSFQKPEQINYLIKGSMFKYMTPKKLKTPQQIRIYNFTWAKLEIPHYMNLLSRTPLKKSYFFVLMKANMYQYICTLNCNPKVWIIYTQWWSWFSLRPQSSAEEKEKIKITHQLSV